MTDHEDRNPLDLPLAQSDSTTHPDDQLGRIRSERYMVWIESMIGMVGATSAHVVENGFKLVSVTSKDCRAEERPLSLHLLKQRIARILIPLDLRPKHSTLPPDIYREQQRDLPMRGRRPPARSSRA
jgi:hypothetical protein